MVREMVEKACWAGSEEEMGDPSMGEGKEEQVRREVDMEMEGPNGIEASWRFVSHALRNGAGVAVHLSKLRARGSDNGKKGKVIRVREEEIRAGIVLVKAGV